MWVAGGGGGGGGETTTPPLLLEAGATLIKICLLHRHGLSIKFFLPQSPHPQQKSQCVSHNPKKKIVAKFSRLACPKIFPLSSVYKSVCVCSFFFKSIVFLYTSNCIMIQLVI